MTVQPVKRQKLTESVAAELLSLIIREGFQAGHRLPPERQLAEQMGVSRASVRDALARLVALGHVGVRQGDGIYVQEPSAEHLSAPFQGILTRLPQKTHDLLEFRRMLEPEVAALAARRGTPEQMAELEACLNAQRVTAAKNESLLNEDLRFHALIAQMAGNGVVVLVLDTLQTLMRDLRRNALLPHYPEATIEYHTRIVQAITARSPQAAWEAMQQHLQNVTQNANQALALPTGGTEHA